MSKLGFQPHDVTKVLVDSLPKRSKDVVTRRFGLDGTDSQTLESIGQEYGITRERVRQIVNQSLKRIRKSDVADEHLESFAQLRSAVENMGSLISEEDLLSELSQQEGEHNHYYFLLHVSPDFKRVKSNSKYHHRWSLSDKIADAVHNAIDALRKNLSKQELVSEEKLLQMFRQNLAEHLDDHQDHDDEALRRWLGISKEIDSNPLGEWGPASSPIVKLKGMRDYAYLVLKKHGSPMHFTEVTAKIEELFGKSAHQATTHNELIRDSRFVLVGRGLYALKEWGYKEGVVRDVIADILQSEGPLPKEEIIERVLRERYVKPNTVSVNLQDQKHFTKNSDGTYDIVS
jgi:hypothetical protein